MLNVFCQVFNINNLEIRNEKNKVNNAVIEKDAAAMKIKPMMTQRINAPPIINHLLVRGLEGWMANTDHLWIFRNKKASPAPNIAQNGRRNMVFKLHLDP